MNNRSIERQKQEAEIFADTQKNRNFGRKRHDKKVKPPNGIAIGGEALEILRKRHRLNGKQWSNPVGSTTTLDDIKYGIGSSRAQFKRATNSNKSSVPEYYTERDLLTKFGKVLSGDADPEILNQILEMKNRGL